MKEVRNRFANKNLWVLFAVLTSVALAAPRALAASAATLENIQGEVLVHTAGSAADQWTAVTQTAPVRDGDSVKTKNGTATLVYADQATFAIGANTSFTLQQKPDTQDIVLDLGKLSAKINKDKVTKPFQVVTPTAVGAVRGTDVIFDFNDQGQLTVDLQDGGPVHVFNDENEMSLNLTGKKKISVKYDADTGILTVLNDCASDGQVSFSVQGTEYAENPCDKKDINTGGETAGGPNDPPGTPPGDNPEPPDHHDDNPPPPSSPSGGESEGGQVE